MESISNTRLSRLAQYRIQKRCDEDGVFVIEGPKLCDEAVRAGFNVRAVCATAQYYYELTHKGGLEALRRLSPPDSLFEVSQAQLERLSGQRSPNRVWMLLRRPDAALQQRNPRSTGLVDLTLALDGVQDPGNMGTMLRTADWFGIRRVVCSRDTVSCFNPKVVQASMGAIFRTDVQYVDLVEYLNEASSSGCTVYGAMLDGKDVSRLVPRCPAVVVIGNEGNGISPEVSHCLTCRVTIPNVGGTAESLNAASAAAILCYQLSVSRL